MINYINQIPQYQLIIVVTLLITLLCQIGYWLYYSSIAGYRNRHKVSSSDEKLPSVSVIVIVTDETDYIENGLPLLLEQEHPEFEVVVVNDCAGAEVDFELSKMARAYPNLRYTTIKKDAKFNHSRKIPLTIGIKAARYENIVVTATDAHPTNEKWLSFISRGIAGADLVIGYTGFDIQPGFANKVARCSRLDSSIRYLRAAITGHPYRGIYNNIAYTKSVFFSNRGYTHLTMSVGEDDLFVQRISRNCATNVIINPRSTLRQESYEKLRYWWQEQRYRTYPYRHYPGGVRIKTFVDLTSRSLFTLSAVALGVMAACGVITDPYIWASVGALFLIREFVVWFSVRRITRRLGEIKIVWSYMLYEIFSPLTEALLCLSRRLSPPLRVWIQNSK